MRYSPKLHCCIVIAGLFSSSFLKTAVAEDDREKFIFVLARETCAPWDGWQLDINFYSSKTDCDSTSNPDFVINLWRYPLKSGDEIILDNKGAAVGREPTNFTGRAMKFNSSSILRWDEAESAKMKIDSYSKEEVRGKINLQFQKESKIGDFIAKKCKQAVSLCG